MWGKWKGRRLSQVGGVRSSALFSHSSLFPSLPPWTSTKHFCSNPNGEWDPNGLRALGLAASSFSVQRPKQTLWICDQCINQRVINYRRTVSRLYEGFPIFHASCMVCAVSMETSTAHLGVRAGFSGPIGCRCATEEGGGGNKACSRCWVWKWNEAWGAAGLVTDLRNRAEESLVTQIRESLVFM